MADEKKETIEDRMEIDKEPYFEIKTPLKSDFTLHCCGIETTYDSLVDELLDDGEPHLSCRKCGTKYYPIMEKIKTKRIE